MKASFSLGLLSLVGFACAGEIPGHLPPDGGDNPADAAPDDAPSEGDAGEFAMPKLTVSAGDTHTCVLLETGRVRCWGYGGANGLQPPAHIGDDELPSSVDEVKVVEVTVEFGGEPVVQLAAGGTHTCALLLPGGVRCWGTGSYGQLGYGSTEHRGVFEPPYVAGNVDVGGKVVQLSAADRNTCALLDNGAVRCWGYGADGRLGHANTDNIGDSETPASAGDVDIGEPALAVSVGQAHTCALLSGGRVRCWGRNEFGALGYGNTLSIGDDETPASAGDLDIGQAVKQVAVGNNFTCVLFDGGDVRCWGLSQMGQIGQGSTGATGMDQPPSALPNVNIGEPVAALSIHGDGDHVCALLESKKVRCWGRGERGQLGYGNTANIGDGEPPAQMYDVPVGEDATQVSAGTTHTCIVTVAGTVRCWGSSGFGQLGYGDTRTIGDNEFPIVAGDVSYE